MMRFHLFMKGHFHDIIFKILDVYTLCDLTEVWDS